LILGIDAFILSNPEQSRKNRARIAQEISAPDVIFMLYLNITFSRAGFDDIFHMEYISELRNAQNSVR